MNCNDVAAVLDERRDAQLSAAEHYALDEHVGRCESCGFAWTAQAALGAIRVPSIPRSLLDDVLGTIQRSVVPRRARPARVASVGLVLTAGAALATASLVAWQASREDNATDAPVRSVGAADPVTRPRQVAAPPMDSSARADSAGGPQSLPVAEIVPFLVARVPPNYPREALERGLDGEVQVEYTIAANGAVGDVSVVSSSDSIFETAALRAVAQWKYLPRVLDGARVAVLGVRTVIRFELARPVPSPSVAPQATPLRSDEELSRALLAVERGLDVAWQRFSTGDLRGAELELDELCATYERAENDGRVFSFYGYVFTQYGDYGRAIGAYESALAIYAKQRGGSGPREQLALALASLYFARHQYDEALRALLSHRSAQASPLASSIDALIERLRVLGVTEETL